MRNSPQGIDGFTPRRPTRAIGDSSELSQHHIGQTKNTTKIGVSSQPISATSSSAQTLPRPVLRDDINDSLQQIDDETIENEAKKSRRFRKRPAANAPRVRRKWPKRIALLMLVTLLGLGAYMGGKALLASSNVFQGSIFDIFQNRPLKVDASGRSNILILGSTDDDPDHPGNTLTDTIMVVSLDQKKKEAGKRQDNHLQEADHHCD